MRKWDHQWARKGQLCLKFVGPEPDLGVCRQDIWRRMRCWLVNQHWIWWRGLGDTQRQTLELISGPCLCAKARFLSFNRTQSTAVNCLLNGHNTLRRHLYLTGLSDSQLCRWCGAEDETSVHSFGFTQTCIWTPSSWSQKTLRVLHSWDCALLMYSFKYNQQDETLYNILYYCQCSTCFRRFLCLSSGAQNCTHSIWYMPSLLAATASVGGFQLTHASGSSQQAWHIPDAACTVLSSWWWVEKPPETCRALTVIKNIV